MRKADCVLGWFLLSATVLAAQAPDSMLVPAELYPVTLAECYAQTLEQNLDIRRQRAGVELASGTKLIFRARALPRASGSGLAGYTGGSLYGSGGPVAAIQTDLSQPLFDMAIPASLRRGKLAVIISQQALNCAVIEQLHATRLAFVQALVARRLVEIYQQIEVHLQTNVRSVQQRFEAGAVSRQQVRQAETQLLSLKPDLLKAQREYVLAATELDKCKGTKPTVKGPLSLPAPTGHLEYAVPRLDLEKETARIIQRRPDLALLRNLIKTTVEERRVLQADAYPFVALTMFSQYYPSAGIFGVRPEIVSGQEPRQTETRYGAAFTWVVMDAGKTRGAASQVESGRETLEITLRRLEDHVPRELQVLVRTLDTIDARYVALKQSANEAEELLKLVETRVKLGEATQMDFLNAQTSLLSTQRGILIAVSENEMARASFDRILGRYLEFSDQPAK